MAAEARYVFKGKHAVAFLDDTTPEVDIEGAIRSGKTTLCLHREVEALYNHPGMYGMLARWTDEGVFGLVVPLWRRICDERGIRLKWNSHESFDELPNGSRMYIRGLKSQDQTLRYSKFRGLTLSRAYIDQAEEIPEDVYLEVTGRLSQVGYDHQMTISPQSVEEGHWIAQRFPAGIESRGRKYFALSVADNAHNLPPDYLQRLMEVYPPGHPKHRTLILGVRGMNVVGVPVYKDAYNRTLHEKVVAFNPALPLEEGIDFGKHHPCVVWKQQTVQGQHVYLGGILGQDLYLEDFLPIVQRYRREWFGEPMEIRSCCDPAGAADNSQGVHTSAVTVLKQHGFHPRWQPNSNSPAVRLAMVERLAGHMRKRTPAGEALVVSRDRWLRVSSQAVVEDRFLADGFEAGYVWDVHYVSVGSKQVRKPKKDGWYEHGQNCAEYLELNFGGDVYHAPEVEVGPVTPQEYYPGYADTAWMS